MNLGPSNTTEALSSLKILLAEDNLVNQQLAVMMLKRLGYQADVVSCGEEVLQVLQNQSYDVILMDVHMPGISGITATQKICQRYPAEQRPYIIALTACSEASDATKCLEAGMQDYLAKPIDAAALTHVLQGLEERARPANSDQDSDQDLAKDSAQVTLSKATITTQPNKQPTEVAPPQAAIPKGETKEVETQKDDETISALDEQVINAIRKMAGTAAPDLIKQLVKSYLLEAPAMLTSIYQAMETKDCVAMYKAAHSLRSSSANLGAIHVARVCEVVEEKGRAETALDLHEYKPLLEANYNAAQAEFMRYL
ncbi:MAG: response regulator [Cyanobacteria bacterium P01_F01_bin.53]